MIFVQMIRTRLSGSSGEDSDNCSLQRRKMLKVQLLTLMVSACFASSLCMFFLWFQSYIYRITDLKKSDKGAWKSLSVPCPHTSSAQISGQGLSMQSFLSSCCIQVPQVFTANLDSRVDLPFLRVADPIQSLIANWKVVWKPYQLQILWLYHGRQNPRLTLQV